MGVIAVSIVSVSSWIIMLHHHANLPVPAETILPLVTGITHTFELLSQAIYYKLLYKSRVRKTWAWDLIVSGPTTALGIVVQLLYFILYLVSKVLLLNIWGN
jgi:hypothetical protein